MTQRQVIVRDAGHQALDELDAADIPDLSYEAAGAAASAQSAAIAAAATDATTKANAAAAASQPVDSDLTAIAALTTTSYGRGLLALADAAALRTAGGLGTLATQSGTFSGTSSGTNTGDQTVGTIATQNANAVTITGGSVTGITDVTVADGGTGASTAAAARTNLGLVIGTDVEAYVPARGFGTPPTGVLAETYGRNSGSGNQTVLSTAQLHLVAIQLVKGMTVTSIQFYSATTALGVGSNQWFALFDISRNKLAVTSDDTSTAWAANSAKSLNLAVAYLVPTSGLYYIGIMVKATTIPTLMGIGALGVVAAIPPILHGDADSGLTNPASCPNPAAVLTAATTTKLIYGTVS